MAALSMPEGKLTLRRRPGPSSSGSGSNDQPPPSKPAQVMRLSLAPGMQNELLDALRDGQKARLRLGKHPSLHYGSKPQPLHAGPLHHRSELYVNDTDNDTGKGSLYFSGVLSHSLEVQEAKQATQASDEALANLEQSLSAFEKGKESRKTPMISSIAEMKALRAGDNRSATGKEAASLTRMSTSRIDLEKERFFQNNNNRSSPASPALTASRSPQPSSTPTSVPTSHPQSQNRDKIRLEALRVPLSHLLAIRPASVKSLAEQTRSSREDCLSLIRKYGTENRHDRDKFDLRDKAYKELDVWSFPYAAQSDRQEAIENAISAFDRMRLSRQDKLWQMLLPKEERGKGKVLSRLNLTAGPMAKNPSSRPQVQTSEGQLSTEGYGTGNESEGPATGRLTPSGGASSGGNQKTGASQRKPSTDKPSSAKGASSGKPKNTTLTGRVTKKADKTSNKKATSKSDTKYKSAEFIIDSDEDDEEMEDVPAADPPAKVTDEHSTSSTPAQQQTKKSPSSSSSSQSSKDESSEQTKQAPAKAQPSKSLPSTQAPPRAGNSTSPQKPSPLGSSPPTNASDLEPAPRSAATTQSSSSSSPLITQHSRRKELEASQKNATNKNKNDSSSAPSHSLKRKANAEPPDTDKTYGLGISTVNDSQRAPEQKRRRQSSPSSAGNDSRSRSSSGSASPPLSHEILRQKLRDKSRLFKQYYARYRALHAEMSNHPNPPRTQLEKLERQHVRLEKMKQEIWDEDRRLRRG